jgi:hypothetical protein
VALASVVGAMAAPGAAGAQSARAGIQALCPALVGCLDEALAVEAIQAGVGLLMSGGSELPGSASTLGRRFGTTPRVAVMARVGLANGSYPALGEQGLAPETSSWVPALQGAVAVGLFDGWRPAPTVGGLFSVDLMATAGVGVLPSDDGFQRSVSAVGYGVRIGVIRESFTLPGVTLSAVRRHLTDVEWAGSSGSGARIVELDAPRVTSLRASVGKDLLALGISAGVGWERVESDGRFSPPGGGSGGAAAVEFSGLRTDRTLFFGGLTATFLVLQLHGEAGYAAGFDPVQGRSDPAFDPTAGSIFFSLSGRLLF